MTVQAVFAGDTLFEVTGIGYEPKGEFLLNGKSFNQNDYPVLSKTLLCGVLCNGAQLLEETGSYKIFGDPTEAAILTCAAKLGLMEKHT